MRYPSHILFSYDNHPLTQDNMNAFQFSTNEIKIINHLSEIIEKYNGIYLLGGNKGTGKTSIMEQARTLYDRKISNRKTTCFCKINSPLQTDNLCLRILYEVSNANILPEKTDLPKQLSTLIKGLENSIKIKDVYSTNSSAKAEISQEINYINELSVTPSFPFFSKLNSLFKGEWSRKKSTSKNVSKAQQQQFDTYYELDRKYTEENIRSKFIKFMHDISSMCNYKFIIILDELDKIPKEEILNFLYINKILLLESDILFFLICDLQQTIFLEDSHAEYFNEIIYIPELSEEEFVIVTRELELSENIEDALSLFYMTKGNHRSLIHSYMHDCRSQLGNDELMAKSFFLTHCLYTQFFKQIPSQYKSVLIDFLVFFIDTLQLLGFLTKTQLEKIKEDFILQHSIQSIKIILMIDQFVNFLSKPISVSELSFLHNNCFSEQDEITDKLMSDLFLKEIVIYYNDLFSFESIFSYYKKFKIRKFELQNEYYEKISSIFDNTISIDNLLDNRILHYLQTNRRNEIYSLLQSEITLVYDQGDGDHTENAIDKIMHHMTEIIGVVLFHPKKSDGSELNNGLIILDNGLRSIGIPYIGYPGLTSHKPSYFKMFIDILKKYKIVYRTLGEKNFCLDVFANRTFGNDDDIKEIVEQNKDIWARELLECKKNSN